MTAGIVTDWKPPPGAQSLFSRVGGLPWSPCPGILCPSSEKGRGWVGVCQMALCRGSGSPTLDGPCSHVEGPPSLTSWAQCVLSYTSRVLLGPCNRNPNSESPRMPLSTKWEVQKPAAPGCSGEAPFSRPRVSPCSPMLQDSEEGEPLL